MVRAHIAAALVAGIVFFGLVGERSSGQVVGKAKPKPGEPLQANPADLPKAGDPLSTRTPVQRPATLKGVRSWTIETTRHRWYPTKIALSPDGRRLATGGYDGIIRVWNTETGDLERALVGHDSYVLGLDWSPDGTYLASAGSYDGTARVWDARSGMPVRVLKGHKGYVRHAVWSPDGRRLLTAGGNSGFVTLWDVVAVKQLETTEYGNPIQDIDFSVSGDRVAVSAARAGTYIADAVTLKTIHALKEALDAGQAVAFSPDGKRLAAGSSKQTVIYDVESGTAMHKLATPGYSLAWIPASDLLIAPNGGAVVPYAGPMLQAGKPLPVSATSLALSKDGAHLFALLTGRVTHWDFQKNSVVRTMEVGELGYMMWSNGRPIVAGLNTSNSPTVWDPTTGKKLATLAGHTGPVTEAAWGPGGKFLVSGSSDKTAIVWNWPDGTLRQTLGGHEAAVTAVAVASDGKIATGSGDRKVRIWPASGEEPLHTLTEHRDGITALAWARDNTTLATGGKDRQVILWNGATGKLVRSLDHPSEVMALAFSPDGSRLAVGSIDDRLRIYQVPAGKELAVLEMGGSPPQVTALAWSADGLFIVGGRGNHSMQYWNTKTKAVAQNLRTMAPVTGVAFSPDNRTIISTTLDRSIRLWDTASGKVRLTYILDREQLLAISADGNYRAPDPDASELIAVVQTDKGQETLSLKDFAARFGFRNAPGQVK